jgi:hypothetical protein
MHVSHACPTSCARQRATLIPNPAKQRCRASNDPAAAPSSPLLAQLSLQRPQRRLHIHKFTTKGTARAFAQRNHTRGKAQRARAAAADRCIVLLGEFSDALDVVKTASVALEADEQLNWGAKIKQLDAKGADKAVTKYLDHIRDQYRFR